MSFGLGTIHAKSSKQKLNTKSSTEAELVGVSEYLPYNIWILMFLHEQGYSLKSNVLQQDNQSAIRMEKNGRNSCTGNSRHVNIRYFFVKDRIDKGELTVDYCPTDIMLADFLTKPLQGYKFQLFRDVIMGYKPISALFVSSVPKERVGYSSFCDANRKASEIVEKDDRLQDKADKKGEEKKTYAEVTRNQKLPRTKKESAS